MHLFLAFVLVAAVAFILGILFGGKIAAAIETGFRNVEAAIHVRAARIEVAISKEKSAVAPPAPSPAVTTQA